MDDKRLQLQERKNKLLEGSMGPEDELGLVDLGVETAALDERDTMFDPDTAPKPPDMGEEATMNADGTEAVDMQRDTPLVDNLASFDLSDADLSAADVFDVDL